MSRTLREFVAEQVSRGEALPASQGYNYSEAAQIEICNWLEARSGEAWEGKKQSDFQWLQDSMGARRVKATMDEIMEGDKAPTMADVRGAWNRLHGDKQPQVNYDCPDCGGSGYQIVVSHTGATGARRCQRGCAVPADRFDAVTGQGSADSEANGAWAAEVARDIAAKMEKPRDPARTPPPLLESISESDFEKLGP